MPERVISENEVSLNGVRFPIIGRVQRIPNLFAPKQVFGDYTRDSNPRASSITFSDFRGGVLLDTMQGNQTNRCWQSTCNIRVPRQLTLPPLRTDVTDISASPPNDQTNVIADYEGNIYPVVGNDVLKFDDADLALSKALASTGRHVVNAYMGGAPYLVVSSGTAYEYFDGTTWASSSSDTDAGMVFWDTRLWGISQTGAMFYSLTLGTDTAVAKIPASLGGPSSASINRLFLMETGNGKAIHAISIDGQVWAYDAANDAWIDTKLNTPTTVTWGEGQGQFVTEWRGFTYIASGLAVWEIGFQGGVRVVRSVGLDQDDGLEVLNGARISSIVGTANELIASVSHDDTNFVHPIYAWDTKGWYQLAETSSHTDEVFALLPATAFSTYRLYIGGYNGISHLPLYDLGQNPKQITSYTYATAGVLKTPWFHADQTDVVKNAVRVRVETRDTKVGDNVKIEYAIDYDEGSSDASYVTLANSTFTDGLIDTTASGITETIFLPPRRTGGNEAVDPVGVAFKSIRFKISLARGGGSTTVSPVMVSLSMEYEKILARKEGYTVLLNLTKTPEYKGRTPLQLRSALQTAKESDTLVEFSFRDDTGGTRNYFVRIQDDAGDESTGHDETGRESIRVLEV